MHIVNANNINNNMESKHHYTGLTAAQVAESRAKYGENVLTPPAKEPLWRQFLDKFRDPLIIILLIAGVLSILISCYEYFGLGDGLTVFFEPVGIFVAIMLATGLAFYFEYQADKEFAILNQVNDDEPVEVIRNANTTQIPRRDVVVGDIVLINTGEEIPADGELIEATLLHVDESTLTGEPICTKTTIESEFDADATFPSNHVMKGTKVMEGHGIMRVLAIGDHTEQGKVFDAVQIDNSVKTPLDEQLDGLGRLVAKLSYCVGASIIIGRILMYFLSPSYEQFDLLPFIAYLLRTLMIAVTLVVVSVPEGLPMAVTLSLAYSMRRMLKTNNLVRKMHACETMGATTVICTDKTGTLTQNRMTVYKTNFYGLKDQQLSDNENSRLIKEGIAVNTTAFLDFSEPGLVKTLGNPTEAALLLWLNGQQVNYRELRENAAVIDQLTFSTERKYMATLVDSPVTGKKILYVKGAPEIVFAQCKYALIDGELQPIARYKTTVEAQLLEYQNQAMRTLGFAYQVIEDHESRFKEGRLHNAELTFLGIAAISDPIRPDVPEAVKRCFDAGIQVKMVTGDTPGTAKEIGRQIGLWTEKDTDRNRITGVEFARLTDQEALERVLDLKIMSRARPMDKQRLVQLLQQKQAVVAVTGDGTNDAPALNHAHVGLSMGSGTSVAKEASDITLLDDSFSSITSAVMWGRSVYQNIQRFILFQLTINVAALIIVLLGSLFGSELPITVTQMLWVNLIMDTFAAGALASLPPSPEVMKRKPRDSNAFIIVPQMRRLILATGIAFVVILLGLLYVLSHYAGGIDAGTPEGLRNLTIFFTVFVMLQFWNMFNAKTFGTNDSAFKNIFKSEGFLTVGMAIIVGQVLVVNFGGSVFRTVPLTWGEWMGITLATSVVLWVGEIFRAFKRMKK